MYEENDVPSVEPILLKAYWMDVTEVWKWIGTAAISASSVTVNIDA
jgi:hypothetical protein